MELQNHFHSSHFESAFICRPPFVGGLGGGREMFGWVQKQDTRVPD
jgi:hypothetical protein